MISALFYHLPSIVSLSIELACFILLFWGSGASVPIVLWPWRYQCCQEIDRCGEVMEPADNTEGVKKNFLDTIFSANSGPSNFY